MDLKHLRLIWIHGVALNAFNPIKWQCNQRTFILGVLYDQICRGCISQHIKLNSGDINRKLIKLVIVCHLIKGLKSCKAGTKSALMHSYTLDWHATC